MDLTKFFLNLSLDLLNFLFLYSVFSLICINYIFKRFFFINIYSFFNAGATGYGVLRIDNDTLRSRFSFPGYDNQTSVDSNGYPTDLGCEKFGSKSDGVYVTPECDYSHMSSHSYDNSSTSHDNSSSFTTIILFIE